MKQFITREEMEGFLNNKHAALMAAMENSDQRGLKQLGVDLATEREFKDTPSELMDE